jgi:hypothetical protein
MEDDLYSESSWDDDDWLFGKDDYEEEEEEEEEEDYEDNLEEDSINIIKISGEESEDDLGDRELEDDLEDYDEEDEENPEDSYDFSEEELEPKSSCFMCGNDDFKTTDRWNFKIANEEPAWICRNCHSQFGSVESFNKFMENDQYRRLYMKASTLLRMLVLGAPSELIIKSIISGMPSVLFWTDEYGGSDGLRQIAREELEKIAEKYLGNRKD